MATLAVTGRFDLSDVQWAVLEPAAGAEEAGSSAEVEQMSADRWHPLAGVGRFALAGCAGAVWALADGIWVVPALAVGWGLGADRDRSSVAG